MDFEEILEEVNTDQENTADEELTLESILTEYGGGMETTLLSGAEPEGQEEIVLPKRVKKSVFARISEKVKARLETMKAAENAEEVPKEQEESAEEPAEEPAEVAAEETPADATEEPAEEPEAIDAPLAPGKEKSVSLQEVLEQTVQSVMSEDEPIILPKERKLFFGRKRERDTEELYENMARQKEEEAAKEPDEEEQPEPPARRTVQHYQDCLLRIDRVFCPALLTTVLMWIAQVVMQVIPALRDYAASPITALVFCAMELAVCVIGREIFIEAFRALRERRITMEQPVALACIVTALDTVLSVFVTARAELLSFHAVACTGIVCLLYGRKLMYRAMYDTFRVAALDDTASVITVTAGGAAKYRGTSAGFYHCAHKENASEHWILLVQPLLLAATFVFAVLATVENQAPERFLWNWSILLFAANSLAFPLVYALPFKRLAHRLFQSGTALGGYGAAKEISQSNCVILTDGDLFTAGTIVPGNVKLFGEESGKAIAYAAAMAKASGSGLQSVFHQMLESSGGVQERVSDLDFYEEGGVGGTIHGETVLFGTAQFCRKMHITVPSSKLKTAVYLAVDGELIAIFALKYLPSQNTGWALHALRRSHLTAVLAVRDGNITPQLLKRKFKLRGGVVFPKISTRLALSESGSGKPYALLLREGVTPFAEATVGAKRLVRTVGSGTVLAILGSIVSELLAFYFTFIGAHSTLTPINMILFLLLWAFAALVNAWMIDRF